MRKKVLSKVWSLSLSVVMIWTLIPSNLCATEISQKNDIQIVEYGEQAEERLSVSEEVENQNIIQSDVQETPEMMENKVESDTEELEEVQEQEMITSQKEINTALQEKTESVELVESESLDIDSIAVESKISELDTNVEEEISAQEEDSITTMNLNNPRIVQDPDMCPGDKVTWDCIWFGSYPQTEVVSPDPVYNILQNATDWDENNDITINGEHYRRMTKEDATNKGNKKDDNYNYYEWSDSTTYHYFKYEPIKWRVLNISGKKAFLLSDVVLDDQKYNLKKASVTWETSTIRSWLNGYEAGANKANQDYTSKNFIHTAFSSEEEEIIDTTNVVNKNNLSWYSVKGGNNTNDKIFLLSQSEVYTSNAKKYGFSQYPTTFDKGRVSKNSEYARAMGSDSDKSEGDCHWWLRSPGEYQEYAAYVTTAGWLDDFFSGTDVSEDSYGVRPALVLDLSSSDLYSYAGTVVSEGGHVWKEWIKKATLKEDGEKGRECIIISCGKVEKEVIPHIENIDLSTRVYTYTGKVKKPSVKVTDANGEVIDKSNYIVTYPSGRKNVGSYKVTIKFKGDKYTGSTTRTFKINPKSTKLNSVKSMTKGKMTVKWAKNANATGYQIQYAKKSSFSGAKSITIPSYNTTIKTISSLTKGKKYYVRVRCYKTVNGKKYYSTWSNIKSATVKK